MIIPLSLLGLIKVETKHLIIDSKETSNIFDKINNLNFNIIQIFKF